MKFRILIFILLCWCVFGLAILQPKNLPSIILPKFAQHKTIGELPFIEMMDDGDFYEMDGSEYGYSECVKTGWKKIPIGSPSELYQIIQDKCAFNHREQLNDECINRIIGQCEYKKTKKQIAKCEKGVRESCLNTGKGYPKCSDMDKLGLMFTCGMSFEETKEIENKNFLTPMGSGYISFSDDTQTINNGNKGYITYK